MVNSFMRLKRVVSLTVIVTVLFSIILVPAKSNAAEMFSNDELDELSVNVFSEKFPDAHVEQETIYINEKDILLEKGKVINNTSSKKVEELVKDINDSSLLEDYKNNINQGNTLVASVKGTVYVKEKIETVDDIPEIVESKVLSYEEIPKELLDNTVSSYLIGTDSDTYYKLTLRLNIFKGTDTSTRYILAGFASWGTGLPGKTAPAKGDDYIGFTWGGGFDYSRQGCVVESSEPRVSLANRVVDYIPNGGIVWGFEEYKSTLNYGPVYAKKTTIGTHLNKRSLTGGVNTTSVVLKYIHTFSSTKGSISISPGSEKVAGSITLQGVKDQWPLAVSVSGLRY